MPADVAADALTVDDFLGGRLALRQPQRGFRSGSDAVLLAAAVPALDGQHVLDAGAGAGVVALCLAARCAGVRVDGIELQADLAALAHDNAAAAGLAARVRVHAGDILSPPAPIRQTDFDHVVCNPPYFHGSQAPASPDATRAAARTEVAVDLADWVAFCLRRTKPGGTLTFIQRSERLPALLAALAQGAGAIILFPLWSAPARPAKRLIVQAVKGARGPLELLPGLRVQDEGGDYTPAARRVVRDGAALRLTALLADT